MIRYILALLLLSLTAQAEPLRDAVRSRQPRLQDPAEIRAELTAPSAVTVTNTVVVTKDAAQLHWEQRVLGDMMTLRAMLTGSPDGALEYFTTTDSASQASAVAAVAQARPELAGPLLMYSTALINHRDNAEDRGLWPLPPHFGLATYTEQRIETVPGPAWWQSAGLSAPPTIDEIQALME